MDAAFQQLIRNLSTVGISASRAKRGWADDPGDHQAPLSAAEWANDRQMLRTTAKLGGVDFYLEISRVDELPGYGRLCLGLRVPVGQSWPGWSWVRLSGFALPPGILGALANGHNCWSESPILGRGDRLLPESNPLQEPFGDHDYYRYADHPGAFHAWSLSYATLESGSNALFAAADERAFYTVFEFDLQTGQFNVAIETDGMDLSTMQSLLGEARSYGWQGTDRLPLGEWLLPLPGATTDLPLAQVMTYWRQRLCHHDQSRRPQLAHAQVLNALGPCPIRGYTSWYYRYTQIDASWLHDNLAAVARTRPNWRVFQVDDGYQQRIGDWLKPAAGFPGGVAPVLRAVRAAGMTPGLWWAPFVALEDSTIWQAHPEWFLRQPGGEPILCGDFSHWGGKFYALDTELAPVQQHFATILDRFVNDWGAGFIKADFLYAAGRRPGGGLTRAARAARAHNLLFNLCVERQALLLSCGASLSAAYGNCHFSRIGPDVLPAWEDPKLAMFHSREKCSSRASLVNAVTRSFLDHVAFFNDPDVYILRDQQNNLTAAERRTLLAVNHLLGNLVFSSDHLGEYPPPLLATLTEIEALRDQFHSPTLIQSISGGGADYAVVTTAGRLDVHLTPAPDVRWNGRSPFDETI